MTTEVEIQGIGIIEFPDSMTPEEIQAALRKQFQPERSASEPVSQFNDPRGAALTLGSAAVAQPVSGLAGLVGLAAGLVPGGESPIEKAERFRRGTAEALTIEPPNPASARVLESVATGAEKAAEFGREIPVALASTNLDEIDDPIALEMMRRDGLVPSRTELEESTRKRLERGIGPALGEATFEATGSPALATAAELIPVTVLSALGFKGLRTRGKEGVTQLRDDVSKIVRERGLDPTDTRPNNIEAMRQVIREELDARNVTPTVNVGGPTVNVAAPDMSDLTKAVNDLNRVLSNQQKAAAGFSAEVQGVLRRRNIDPTDTSKANQRAIRDALTDEMRARQATLERAGLEPTRAQVTRSADDFQQQQELAKRSNRVRDALEDQEARLTQQFDEAVEGTGGRAATSESSVANEILRRSTALDDRIGELYRRARDTAGEAQTVNIEAFVRNLDNTIPSDRVMKGLPAAVRGNLVQRGLINNKGEVLRRASIAEAEEVRQFINSFFDSTSGAGRRAIRSLKDSLDSDVFRAAGRDLFREARQAKIDFEDSLSRAKVSKFDKNNKNVVRDILENKIDPDQIADKLVLQKGTRAEDLRQVRDFLQQSDDGIRAFDDLRAEAMQIIKDKAFKGPIDAQGNQALSRAALENVLNRIGEPRLKILFTQEERNFLNLMRDVAKLREPVRGTALGKGPSAQAIADIESLLNKVPLAGDFLVDVVIDSRGKAVLKPPRTE